MNALKAAHQLLTDENVAKHFPAVDPNKLLANQRTRIGFSLLKC
ncbi:MAG: hypothetical protein ACLU4J_00295 [Butyricimonas paravirosa]